ncbi:MAG: ABC transporter ATP-binding protein [Gammaproteobacteria bacterium]
MNDPLLKVDALSGAGFGPVSLSIGRGECLGVSGPSGSGKSRLLRAIADLDPARGTVTLDGRSREQWSAPAWRGVVGFVPAETYWWAERVGAHFRDPDRIDLVALGLRPDILDADASELSSGEKQRLGVLRQLELEPRVLLLDEPTANLDAEHQATLEGWVDHHRRARSMAVVWVSHDPDQLRRVAGRVLLLQGRKAS